MEDKQLKEILNHYFDGECTIKRGPSGMNNLTRYIEHDGDQYVLRVYRNHQGMNVVKMEHDILKQIEHFNVPCPIETKTGDTIAKVNDVLATVFIYKEGVNLVLREPKQYYNYGETVGGLSLELKEILVEVGEYLPYYELDKGYPNHGAEAFCREVADEFVEMREELQLIDQLLNEIRERKNDFQNLPHQLIHGDINCSNLLMNETGMISAILDFEFVTRDLRAMEVAICLSELLHEVEGQEVDELDESLKMFCKGYRSKVSLSSGEIELLPPLILLRRLDVFLHFLVRYQLGIVTENIDSVHFLKKQIKSIAKQEQWLSRNSEQLKLLFK